MPTAKIPFRTAYGENERHYCKTGSGIEDVFGYEIDDQGRKKLVKTGETNLYAKIQESLEETKIENILKRVSIGDMSDFRPDGIYADTTEIPKNLIEAQKAMQQLENVWNQLPADIKKEYNWNVDEFIAASGSEKWMKDMGYIKEETETPAPVVEEKGEVKDE